ncbi:MotA/TolQ/ExbB proton channel family protein [Paraglaciecola aquimarina]|uniref:MotA/TolQ/ExbB proton channel family protein n=1 Tax=Paraglaciecola aquimarina TaxID=1235557 RepID=A0ABU3T0C3_9ALTE|nr:MotA/TolQ/ExbB proton channel family protein [Paraglaciecola aquimarina]MDU0355667.1 MotA/TolQ/ExbB proton channel family protein [Paraglaciecola aquimarina]
MISEQLINNTVVWVILLLAAACYSLLAELLLDKDKNSRWQQKVNAWQNTLQVSLSCLPLLGLLGTITGLLSIFSQMSQGNPEQQGLLSGGIADAMLTTQIGLLLVIPGWLLLASLKQKLQQIEIAEIKDRACVPS